MVNNFGKGRVFIAGGKLHHNFLYLPYLISLQDAAHVHSPTGGQVNHPPSEC